MDSESKHPAKIHLIANPDQSSGHPSQMQLGNTDREPPAHTAPRPTDHSDSRGPRSEGMPKSPTRLKT